MSSSERYRSLVAVYALIVHDHKLLLLQRQNTGYRDGDWDMPAGHLEEGETLLQAVIREAGEEACITIHPADVHFAHLMHRRTVGADGRIYLDCFFRINAWSGEPHIGEPEKCSSLEWFPLDKLPNRIIPYQKAALDHVQRQVFYSEWGWEK